MQIGGKRKMNNKPPENQPEQPNQITDRPDEFSLDGSFKDILEDQTAIKPPELIEKDEAERRKSITERDRRQTTLSKINKKLHKLGLRLVSNFDILIFLAFFSPKPT